MMDSMIITMMMTIDMTTMVSLLLQQVATTGQGKEKKFTNLLASRETLLLVQGNVDIVDAADIDSRKTFILVNF